jgi:hypothetical protein
VNTADLANDRHLILDALARYAWGFDEADFELLADAFTEDASTGGKVSRTDIEWGPLFGRAQIVEVLASIRRGQTDQRRHSLSTARFHSQSEDAADVSVYITVFGSEQLKTRVVTTGWYRAEFARQADGAWRMKKLDAQLDAPF